MTTVLQLNEQLKEDALLNQSYAETLLPYIADGGEKEFKVSDDKQDADFYLKLRRKGNDILATGSYFVGVDWVKENELAIQVSPKMNSDFEIDYVRMLNEALCDKENLNHLQQLVTISFHKPAIPISQQQDLLSIFLITEYLSVIRRIVTKGLRKSYYMVEENLNNKIKGRCLVARNVKQNLSKGRVTNNFCRYQVYGIDSCENRILKRALRFCAKQLEVYRHAFDTSTLDDIVRFVKPHFDNVGEEVTTKAIQTFKGNPIFKEHSTAVELAQLLIRRYSYDITLAGNHQITTPPFWIDMSKLFELYVFRHLRLVFTGKNEVCYHPKAHRQELDYLLKPCHWPEPYVVDAKYKPRYKGMTGIDKDDARQVAGYARLQKIYDMLELDAENALPIKCLIVYPDQEQQERFAFTNTEEPTFEKVKDYIRFYKIGIRLPVIQQ